MSLLRCPHCHFSIRPRATWLTPDYCPRCLAKRRVAEPLQPIDEPTGLHQHLRRAGSGAPDHVLSIGREEHRPDAAGP